MIFQWPTALLGLALVPILMLLYALAQRRRRAYAIRFTNLELLGQVVGRGPGIRRHLPPLLFLLGLAALLVSLARPSAVIAVPRDQVSAVLVVDVSGSMAAQDLRPNRMDAAKQAARAFVEALPPEAQVSLVSFSSAASVNAPLTRDHTTVARAIHTLNANGGTAIGDGLNAALDQLAQRPTNERGERAPALVLLLSDGQSTQGLPPENAARRAKQEGIKVHTVGVGQRGAAPLVSGRLPVQLDEKTLQTIATETGGQYFYAAASGELERIYAELGSEVAWVEEKTEVTFLFGAASTLLMTLGGLLGLRWFAQLP